MKLYIIHFSTFERYQDCKEWDSAPFTSREKANKYLQAAKADRRDNDGNPTWREENYSGDELGIWTAQIEQVQADPVYRPQYKTKAGTREAKAEIDAINRASYQKLIQESMKDVCSISYTEDGAAVYHF